MKKTVNKKAATFLFSLPIAALAVGFLNIAFMGRAAITDKIYSSNIYTQPIIAIKANANIHGQTPEVRVVNYTPPGIMHLEFEDLKVAKHFSAGNKASIMQRSKQFIEKHKEHFLDDSYGGYVAEDIAEVGDYVSIFFTQTHKQIRLPDYGVQILAKKSTNEIITMTVHSARNVKVATTAISNTKALEVARAHSKIEEKDKIRINHPVIIRMLGDKYLTALNATAVTEKGRWNMVIDATGERIISMSPDYLFDRDIIATATAKVGTTTEIHKLPKTVVHHVSGKRKNYTTDQGEYRAIDNFAIQLESPHVQFVKHDEEGNEYVVETNAMHPQDLENSTMKIDITQMGISKAVAANYVAATKMANILDAYVPNEIGDNGEKIKVMHDSQLAISHGSCTALYDHESEIIHLGKTSCSGNDKKIAHEIVHAFMELKRAPSNEFGLLSQEALANFMVERYIDKKISSKGKKYTGSKDEKQKALTALFHQLSSRFGTDGAKTVANAVKLKPRSPDALISYIVEMSDAKNEESIRAIAADNGIGPGPVDL